MSYYELDPEVAGGLGSETVIPDTTRRPLILDRFHYDLDDWSGDDILTTVTNFVVTRRLAEGLRSMQCSGCEFDEVLVTTSELFDELSDSGLIEGYKISSVLPPFEWLKITGQAGTDDFGYSAGHSMVVSSRVLELLRSLQIANCDVSAFE